MRIFGQMSEMLGPASWCIASTDTSHRSMSITYVSVNTRRQRSLTHLPYRSWCPHCVAARRPNTHHRAKQASLQRTVRLLVADFCYARRSRDEDLASILVCQLYSAKAIMATVTPKSVNEHAIPRLTAPRSRDVERVCARATRSAPSDQPWKKPSKGVSYNPRLEQLVPEASAVGESQSNGKAERTVQRLVDMLATYKSPETNIDARIPSDRPIINWLVEHNAAVYNRHDCDEDGATPYELAHGQTSKCKHAEFGEQVFYYVPQRLGSKLNLRFQVGKFLENAQSSNEAFVAIANEDIVKSRASVRVIKRSRWSKAAILGV